MITIVSATPSLICSICNRPSDHRNRVPLDLILRLLQRRRLICGRAQLKSPAHSCLAAAQTIAVCQAWFVVHVSPVFRLGVRAGIARRPLLLDDNRVYFKVLPSLVIAAALGLVVWDSVQPLTCDLDHVWYGAHAARNTPSGRTCNTCGCRLALGYGPTSVV